MNQLIKHICGLALLLISGAAFGQNAAFTLTTSGDSHIYWPYGSSQFNSKTGSWCCNNGASGSYCPTGTNNWRVTNGTGCGFHTGGDTYAEDWQRDTRANTLNQPVYAPLSGTIKVARDVGNSYGNMVVIQSDVNAGFAFMVAHLNSDNVYEGQYVSVGDLIGYVGASGGQAVVHTHVVLYKGITASALENLKYGATPPSYMAAPFYMDAVGGGSSSGTNLSANAAVYSHTSDYGAGYTPWQAIDGSTSTKWVSDGVNATQTMYLNLNGNFNVTKLVLKHAGAGGEWSAMNTEHYEIKYYNGSSWVQAVNHYNTSQQNITQHTVNFNAQYVLLRIYDPGVDNYTRLPEWEIWGSGSGARTAEVQPPMDKIEASQPLITLFPNPVQDQLSINWTGDNRDGVKIDIINTSGQVVKSMNVDELNGNNAINMDIANLNPGVYQLAVSGKEGKEVSSFVKK
ncbi:peptidoglycan DD-metalloendopeptidase family protein [Roseivirga sp. BDSF3-8]|uniref:peptidoglycan DD-metalloendopeptidase family protein n=1 Tax=Roseivirga sp. BDSF3-8 TaxID=3241598 RepID=UPI003531ED1C